MAKRLFSLIVPIYNVEKYLRQCVDSLLAQNFDDYEIILVDDGSPDSCPLICDEYAEKSSRIRVVHKPNGGLSDARNKGAEVAEGEYIIFVDSDDFWKHDHVLSDVSSIIAQYHPDIIVSDIIKYYSDDDKYLAPSIVSDAGLNGKSKGEILDYLYYTEADLKISACQKFIKSDIVKKHPFTKGLVSEDVDWTLDIFANSKSICIYSVPFYCYRQQREGSITYAASSRSFNSLTQILDKWSVKIPKVVDSSEEKYIYLGYLAFQLSVMMVIWHRLPREEKKTGIDTIKRFSYLFDYPLNFKTAKVKKILKACGVKNTCYILAFIRKLRSNLHRG